MKKIAVAIVLLTLVLDVVWSQNSNSPGMGLWLQVGWKEYQKLDARTPNADLLRAGQYMGYVTGVAMEGQAARIFTFPTSVSPYQLFAIVGKYIDSHPDEWNVAADTLIYDALVFLYPYKE